MISGAQSQIFKLLFRHLFFTLASTRTQNMAMRQNFACDECEFNTVYRHNFWQHYSVRHLVNKLQNERLYCDECDRPFQVPYSTMQSAQLKEHFARKHGSEAFRQQFLRNTPKSREKPRNFACDECPMGDGRSVAAIGRSNLINHIARNHGSAEFRDAALGPKSRVCDDCWKLFRGSQYNVASHFAQHWNSSHVPIESRQAVPSGGRRLSDPSARCDDCLVEIVGRHVRIQFRHWVLSHANSSSGLHLAAEFRKKRTVQCDSCGISIHSKNLFVHWHRAHRPPDNA